MSCDWFLPEKEDSFLKIKNLCSTSKLESRLTQISKDLLALRYLDIPSCPSQKLHIWNFYQGLTWPWYILKCSSDRISNDFFTRLGILIGWACGNVQLMFLFCQFSDSYLFEAIVLNSSSEVSIESFFGRTGFFKRNLLYVCSVFLCATLTEKIAVRLRLLFSWSVLVLFYYQLEESSCCHEKAVPV